MAIVMRKAGPSERPIARTTPLVAAAAQTHRGWGSPRLSRRSDAQKQIPAAISGPLGLSDDAK